MNSVSGRRSSLLVSVRSVAEAEAALAGGADLIDVKEPTRGSLGRADEVTVRAVVRHVAGRRPVSAALGELRLHLPAFGMEGLTFAKWGLAGHARLGDWRRRLSAAAIQLAGDIPGCLPVAVAYVDWQRALAPTPAEVCAFAALQRSGVLLLDTWCKDGTTLLDWLPLGRVAGICNHCAEAGIRVALAGSLGPGQIRLLRKHAAPDWFAVRGAACRDGRRDGDVDEGAVRRLVDLIHRFAGPTPHANR